MKFLTLALTCFSFAAMAESWTGTLSDASCGAKHADASEASQKCAQRCFGRSGQAVFVVGDKVLKVDAASKEKIAPHIGHKVVIDGTLKDDTVSVGSIKMAS